MIAVIEKYLEDLFVFVERFAFIHEFHAVDLFLMKWFPAYPEIFIGNKELMPNNWSSWISDNLKAPPEILEWLDAVQKCTIKPAENVPLSLQEYIMGCKNLSLPRTQSGQLTQSFYPIPAYLMRGMSEKKRHECERMAFWLQELDRDGLCIDIGSGQGYLSTILSNELGRDVLALDQSDIQTCGAEKRKLAVNQSKESPGHLEFRQIHLCCDENQSSLATSIEQEVSLSSQRISQKSNWILYGLHACGDLSAMMLRTFVDAPHIKGLLNVGCCYNLVTEPCQNSAQPGFPMSRLSTNRNFALGQPLKMLACQATIRIGHTSELDIMMCFKKHFYRCLLQVILIEKKVIDYDRTKLLALGKLRANAFNGGFLKYALAALRKLGIQRMQDLNAPIPSIQPSDTLKSRYFQLCINTDTPVDLSDADILDYEHRYTSRNGFEIVSAVWALRIQLSSIIESIILTDRLLYLLENTTDETTIQMFPIFDENTSPRNMGFFLQR